MKKFLFGFLVIAIICLISSCARLNGQNSGSDSDKETSDNTTSTESNKPPTTEPPTVNDNEQRYRDKYDSLFQYYSPDQNHEDALAKQFLEDIKNNDYYSIARVSGVKDIEAYAFLKDVVIESYEIIQNEKRTTPYQNYYGRKYKVKINVTKSETELFKVGENIWDLEIAFNESSCIDLFKPEETVVNRISWIPQDNVADFCYRYNVFFGGENLTDFNSILKGYIYDGVLNYDNSIHGLIDLFGLFADIRTLEDLEQAAKTYLGIMGFDFKVYSHYDSEKNEIFHGGHGGSWEYCALSSNDYNADLKQREIVLDFYADTSYLVKAQSVKYTVRENNDGTFALISTEVIYDSGYHSASGTI